MIACTEVVHHDIASATDLKVSSMHVVLEMVSRFLGILLFTLLVCVILSCVRIDQFVWRARRILVKCSTDLFNAFQHQTRLFVVATDIGSLRIADFCSDLHCNNHQEDAHVAAVDYRRERERIRFLASLLFGKDSIEVAIVEACPFLLRRFGRFRLIVVVDAEFVF